MKTKLLIIVLQVCATFTRLFAQAYSVTDSLAMLAIDDSCDASGNLNWNTEPDPGKWVGVMWKTENPKKVKELRVYSRSLTGTIVVKAISNLTYLDCSSNQLAGLDVLNLTDLTSLSYYYNQITLIYRNCSILLL